MVPGQSTKVNIRGGLGQLLRWPQLALEPARSCFGFQGIRAVALKAPEYARTVAAGRQRENQMCPAIRARRSFHLAHDAILLPVRNFVNFEEKHPQ